MRVPSMSKDVHNVLNKIMLIYIKIFKIFSRSYQRDGLDATASACLPLFS